MTTTMQDFAIDEAVRVVPTQGGYQQELAGKVTKVTKTQIVVVDEKHPYGVTYRRNDGMPAYKADRAFPCYRVLAIDAAAIPLGSVEADWLVKLATSSEKRLSLLMDKPPARTMYSLVKKGLAKDIMGTFWELTELGQRRSTSIY